MPRGRTESPYSLDRRREIAYQRFSQGIKDRLIAEELQVGRETVARYRREYEQAIQDLARSHPRLLQQAIPNVIRSLEELDVARERIWTRINQADTPEMVSCEHCGHEFEVLFPMRDQNLATLMNSISKLQEQKSKLLGLFGIRGTMMEMVANVQTVQTLLLEFLQTQLDKKDRKKVMAFLNSPQMQQYMGETDMATMNLPPEKLRELAAADEVQ